MVIGFLLGIWTNTYIGHQCHLGKLHPTCQLHIITISDRTINIVLKLRRIPTMQQLYYSYRRVNDDQSLRNISAFSTHTDAYTCTTLVTINVYSQLNRQSVNFLYLFTLFWVDLELIKVDKSPVHFKFCRGRV